MGLADIQRNTTRGLRYGAFDDRKKRDIENESIGASTPSDDPITEDFSGVTGGASSTAIPGYEPVADVAVTPDKYRAQPFEMSTKDGKVSWSGGGALPGSAMKATPEETAAWLKTHSAGQTGVGALLGYQPEAASAGLSEDPVGDILARDNQNAAVAGYNTAVVGQGDARQARIGDANHINEIMRQQALRDSSVRKLIEQYGTDDPKILEKLIPLDTAMQEQQMWRGEVAKLNKLKGVIPDEDYEALKDSLILQMTRSAEEAGKYTAAMAAARRGAGQGDALMSILGEGKP